MKASHAQADEQVQLLSDYQRRVDEQQKLLDDYRALEKNFHNVGEGYGQALLSFEQMETETQKTKAANEALQQQCTQLQTALSSAKEAAQKQADMLKQIVAEMQEAAKASGDTKIAALVGKVTDMEDLQAGLPPIEPTDNVLLVQVADEAIKLSGVDKVDYASSSAKLPPMQQLPCCRPTCRKLSARSPICWTTLRSSLSKAPSR